jgi:hypothetical protein
MKAWSLAIVLAAAAACSGAPEASDRPPIASASAPQETALAAELREKGVADKKRPSPPESPAPQATRRFDVVDLYVSQTDPTGARQLAPYLFNEEWMLIKCEYLSPTLRHYRFQRIVVGNGARLPEVDPFKPRR